MTRSPLFYPLNRGIDGESGGVADLQTDVMRFIAILALCLVAIFALVQSIPLLPNNPAAAEPEAIDAEPVIREPDAEMPPVRTADFEPPAVIEEAPLVITRSAVPPMPRQAQPRIVEQTIATTAVAAAPADVPPPAPTEKGFTLRFETDLALTRLVARNEVGLYAMTPEKAVRMSVNRGTLSFWPASVPNQFHEMDERTVPEEVMSALRRAGSVKTGDVKWGVTLPSVMRRQLEQFLNGNAGGSLIIGGDGTLRLEP